MSCSNSNGLTASSTDRLKPIEEAVERVLNHYGHDTEITNVPLHERDTLNAAQYLQYRLQAFRDTQNCPNCWLPRPTHCICSQCKPIAQRPSKLNRIFLIMHYKEIMMKVDTAKLIWACFPDTVLVVSGIGSEFQPAMAQLEEAMEAKRCLVLFPTDSARTFTEIEKDLPCSKDEGVDVIVVDGTWQQARRMHKKYIPPEEQGGPFQTKLSDDAVAMLARGQVDGQTNTGHQLRKHSVTWRKVATFEATRLFLRDLAQGDGDLSWNDDMDTYQQIANQAATNHKYGNRET